MPITGGGGREDDDDDDNDDDDDEAATGSRVCAPGISCSTADMSSEANCRWAAGLIVASKVWQFALEHHTQKILHHQGDSEGEAL
jgi:hypothetical protein